MPSLRVHGTKNGSDKVGGFLGRNLRSASLCCCYFTLMAEAHVTVKSVLGGLGGGGFKTALCPRVSCATFIIANAARL